MGRSLGIGEIVIIALLVLLLFGGRKIPQIGQQLGRRARTVWRQWRWVWTLMTGSEDDIIRAEREFGRECAREFAAEHPEKPAAADGELVDAVAAKLAAHAGNLWQFTVQVIADSDENAYALPGGFIFVTDSLLRLCGRDEQEVAFVVGHEMSHVLLRHARDRFMAGAILSRVASGAPALGRMLAQLVNQGYSQNQEFDADKHAVVLARKAGFDPAAGERMLGRLERRYRSPGELASYFSSHPPASQRIEAMRKAA